MNISVNSVTVWKLFEIVYNYNRLDFSRPIAGSKHHSYSMAICFTYNSISRIEFHHGPLRRDLWHTWFLSIQSLTIAVYTSTGWTLTQPMDKSIQLFFSHLRTRFSPDGCFASSRGNEYRFGIINVLCRRPIDRKNSLSYFSCEYPTTSTNCRRG